MELVILTIFVLCINELPRHKNGMSSKVANMYRVI